MAKCVTYVSEQVLPMSPVHTAFGGCAHWGPSSSGSGPSATEKVGLMGARPKDAELKVNPNTGR